MSWPVKTGFVFFLLFSALWGQETFHWGKGGKNFSPASLQNLQLLTDKNNVQSLALARQNFSLSAGDRLNSIHVSFDENLAAGENPAPALRALLESAYFRTVRFEDSVGPAASFDIQRHILRLRLPDYSFLTRSDHTGSFSVFFRFRLFQAKQSMEFFHKVGIFEGKKQGLRAIWQKNRLVFEFHNFFWAADGSALRRVEIASSDPIETNQFHNVLLQYRENEGSLTLLVDQREQRKIFLTEDGTPAGSILAPRFHRWDRSSLVIGENYYGALDEMIFANGLLEARADTGSYGLLLKEGDRFRQNSGEFLSKRYQLQHSASWLRNLQTEAVLPAASTIQYFIRCSDRPFPEDVIPEILPFQKIAPGQFELCRGRYFQWKALFFPDPAGQSSPVLHSLSFEVQENPPPAAPRFLESEEVSPGKVVLRLLRNTEMDVIQGGRYHVYYGIRPYEPLGILRFKAFRRDENGNLQGVPYSDADQLKTDDLRYQNRLRLEISNQLIEEHLVYTRLHPEWQFDYPLLQENIPFYFWVTTLDNAWSEAQEYADHESAPSNLVIIRP